MNAWELYTVLNEARQRAKWRRICVEFSEPLPPIDGREWPPSRHRLLDDGRHAYGYTRAQAAAMMTALARVLNAATDEQARAAQHAARDLGLGALDA
jgi:hypothetical protein